MHTQVSCEGTHESGIHGPIAPSSCDEHGEIRVRVSLAVICNPNSTGLCSTGATPRVIRSSFVTTRREPHRTVCNAGKGQETSDQAAVPGRE